MKKFNDNPNVVGKLIQEARKKKNYSKVDVSTKLDLLGVSISRAELYRIENFGMIVKDFELIALCIVLDLNYNDLKKLILNEK